MTKVPPHIEYWQRVFRVVEMYEKPKEEDITKHYLLCNMLKRGFDNNKSNIIILNKNWSIAYYVPAEIIFKKDFKNGTARVNTRCSSDGIARFSIESGKVFCMDLPDLEIFVSEHMKGEPFYIKSWYSKGEQTGVNTMIGESENLVSLLEKNYLPHIAKLPKQSLEPVPGVIILARPGYAG